MVWGEPGDVPVAQDYDDDGKTDLATFRPSNGTWYIWTSSGGGLWTYQWGQPGDVPVTGDYDGNGRADPVIYRPSSAVWWVYPSSATQFGLGGDVPAGSGYFGFLQTAVPTIQLQNLTHPNLGTNFAVGDTYRLRITGPPNQPIVLVQTANGGTATQSFGNTDAYGRGVIDYVEQTANIGTYTQVWSVGGREASPAISFVVGQLGGGVVTTTETGYTGDGHLAGVSSLSINNGAVSTYSATLLDYTAAAYYDWQTVGNLFDNGTRINQSASTVNISTATGLSSASSLWHDYTLRTDHYAIAYFLSGGYYANPFYWGSNCYADSGYCSIGTAGTYAYWITVASIYVGSTVAEQVHVPQDGSLPPFNLSAYDSFLKENPPPNVPTFYSNVTEWIRRISAAYIPALLIDQANNANKDISIPPIPWFVKVKADCKAENGERVRQYTLMDIYGRPWKMDFPVVIRERFTDTTNYGGTPPPANGYWYNRVTPPTENEANASQIGRYGASTYLDHYRGELFGHYSYLQYYYATNFQLPGYMSSLSSQLSYMPLWIMDTAGAALPAQGIEENGFNTLIQTTPMPSQTCPANWSAPEDEN